MFTHSLKRTDRYINEINRVEGLFEGQFFEEFVEHELKEKTLRTSLKAKEEELAALKQQFAFMEQENKYLRELVEIAKLKLKK